MARSGGREQGRHQIALKSSKGSRQALQRHSALQAVEPNRRELAGVRRSRTAGSAPRTAAGDGTGPRRHSPRPARAGRCRTRAACARPASLIQSVVQAGASTSVARRRSHAAGARTQRADVVADRVHGRAAGVGRGDRRPRRWPSSARRPSRRMPRSSMVSTGTSGSGTATAATAQAPRPMRAGSRQPAARHHVTAPRGGSGRGAASRRAGSPWPGVDAVAAAARAPRRLGGHGQGRLGEDALDVRRHGRPQRRRAARRRQPRRRRRVDRVVVEQLGDVGPHARRAPACIRAWDSSVPSPSRSIHWRGVVAVVVDLLDRLGGDRRRASRRCEAGQRVVQLAAGRSRTTAAGRS